MVFLRLFVVVGTLLHLVYPILVQMGFKRPDSSNPETWIKIYDRWSVSPYSVQVVSSLFEEYCEFRYSHGIQSNMTRCMINASPRKIRKYLDALPAQMEYVRSWVQYGTTIAVYTMSSSDLMHVSNIYAVWVAGELGHTLVTEGIRALLIYIENISTFNNI